LPERRHVPPSRCRAEQRAGARGGVASHHRVDVFGLPLHPLLDRRAVGGRPTGPRDPAALAALRAGGASSVRARWLGRGGGDALIGLFRQRYPQHGHRRVVDHQRTTGLERDGGERAAHPVRGLQQRVQPGLCRVGGYQRGRWLMYGHNYWNNRFSPLKTINATNVRRLVARAVYTHGSTQLGSFETTPIVVSGTMYITSPATPNNIVRAFDLRTQKMLWEYTHKNAPVAT